MVEIVPAIDLVQGAVVRLTQGKIENITKYSVNPIQLAQDYQKMGATRIHIIDLDAALSKSDNLETILEIRNKTDIPLQVGGGIRSFSKAEKLLEGGIDQIIMGSLIFTNHKEADGILTSFSAARVIAALDYENKLVKIHGWRDSSGFTIFQAVDALIDRGYLWVLTTAIERDGMLEGPDIETLRVLSSNPKIHLIAAGGISKVEDINVLSSIDVKRVVIGKAIYENTLNIEEILKTAK